MVEIRSRLARLDFDCSNQRRAAAQKDTAAVQGFGRAVGSALDHKGFSEKMSHHLPAKHGQLINQPRITLQRLNESLAAHQEQINLCPPQELQKRLTYPHLKTSTLRRKKYFLDVDTGLDHLGSICSDLWLKQARFVAWEKPTQLWTRDISKQTYPKDMIIHGLLRLFKKSLHNWELAVPSTSVDIGQRFARHRRRPQNAISNHSGPAGWHPATFYPAGYDVRPFFFLTAARGIRILNTYGFFQIWRSRGKTV